MSVEEALIAGIAPSVGRRSGPSRIDKESGAIERGKRPLPQLRRGNSIKGSDVLRRFEALQDRMDELKAKYEQCKDGAFPTVTTDCERVQTSQGGSKVEALAMDLYEIRVEYADVLCDYIDAKLKLFDEINKISNIKYAELILHIYIERKTDVEAAAIMKVSKATINKWLVAAVKELDTVSGRDK